MLSHSCRFLLRSGIEGGELFCGLRPQQPGLRKAPFADSGVSKQKTLVSLGMAGSERMTSRASRWRAWLAAANWSWARMTSGGGAAPGVACLRPPRESAGPGGVAAREGRDRFANVLVIGTDTPPRDWSDPRRERQPPRAGVIEAARAAASQPREFSVGERDMRWRLSDRESRGPREIPGKSARRAESEPRPWLSVV